VGEIDLDGGGVDMYTELTEVMMNQLELYGRRLSEELGTQLRGPIAQLEQMLGKGPIGRAFAVQYNPTADSLVDTVEQAGKAPAHRARSGRVTVAEYQLADALGAQAMPT
jgi:hypothetical protein